VKDYRKIALKTLLHVREVFYKLLIVFLKCCSKKILIPDSCLIFSAQFPVINYLSAIEERLIMKFKSKFFMLMISVTTALVLSACSGDQDQNAGKESSGDHSSHANMDHSGSGELPEGIKEEANPTYKVGGKAIITEDHMPGMDGAEATIVGAYDTVVYSLSYDPTNGGPRVENHKWVIHEELKNPGDQPLKPGDKAIIDTDHMEGMKGAEAVIDTAEEMTVYMVDFIPTDGSEKVTNHQWVTESELSPEK
jgi:hypothetical protein